MILEKAPYPPYLAWLRRAIAWAERGRSELAAFPLDGSRRRRGELEEWVWKAEHGVRDAARYLDAGLTGVQIDPFTRDRVKRLAENRGLTLPMMLGRLLEEPLAKAEAQGKGVDHPA